jgi:hypothetical protein
VCNLARDQHAPCAAEMCAPQPFARATPLHPLQVSTARARCAQYCRVGIVARRQIARPTAAHDFRRRRRTPLTLLSCPGKLAQQRDVAAIRARWPIRARPAQWPQVQSQCITGMLRHAALMRHSKAAIELPQ